MTKKLTNDDYDVVIDVLTKHRDKLQQMVDQNLRSEFIGMGIMDDIRLEQIEKIDQCLALWKIAKECADELKQPYKEQSK